MKIEVTATSKKEDTAVIQGWLETLFVNYNRILIVNPEVEYARIFTKKTVKSAAILIYNVILTWMSNSAFIGPEHEVIELFLNCTDGYSSFGDILEMYGQNISSEDKNFIPICTRVRVNQYGI